MTATQRHPQPAAVVRYEARGAARALFAARDAEVVIAGPAGTGKTTALLQLTHLRLLRTPRARALLVRKTATSLAASALVTYQQQVLHPLDGVVYESGTPRRPAQFRYPNGSVLVVGGMDQASKVLSTDYDQLVVIEATELSLADWETLSSRARYGVLGAQQLLGDCNPSAPTHWLYRRCLDSTARLLESRHQDNPRYHDGTDWTPAGRAYLDRLSKLTGVRRVRLYEGRWAAAEGLVYDGYDPRVHLVVARTLPAEWPRIEGCDFGFRNPFVWQSYGIDPDGRLELECEIYRTERLVEDHAAEIRRLTAGRRPAIALVCDHDAEGRATLERHLGRRTTPAKKAIRDGIQAVAARLRVQADGRPRLTFQRDATVARDAALVEAGRPAATVEEFDSYVWQSEGGSPSKELPVDQDNHGMDCTRYVIMHLDGGRDRVVRVA